MDLAKYRTIFIEESTEHFAEISSALLELEKDADAREAIDTVFRMAHSIKGMAASLEYTPIAELAHRLEDRMQLARGAGRVGSGEELSLLFRGLAALEEMVEAVKEGEDPAPAAPALLADLARPPDAASSAAEAPAGDAAERSAGGEAAGSDAETASARERPEPVPARAGAAPASEVETPRPPPTVRVRTETLDRFLSTVGEVILGSSQVRTSAATRAGSQNAALGEDLDRMDRVVGELQRRALELRTTRVLRIVEPLPRAAREIAQRAGKKVEVEILGAELELDRSILDRLSDPLVHLLRNAVDHGIEAPDVRRAAGKSEVGRIAIEASREKDSIRIAISDDGAGIDLDRVRERAIEAGVLPGDLADDLPPDTIAALVFQPGLSTAGRVSEVSGRGVGMDAVKSTIESLGGSVELASERGRGTTTSLLVPITAAVQRVLLLGVGDETVALPIAKVERILELPSSRIERSGGDAFALIDEELVPVIDLSHAVAGRGAGSVPVDPAPEPAPADTASLVLTEMRGERIALCAERVLGQQQIYVKPVPELLSGLRALSGLTILGDGRPMFLLDLNQIQ